MPRKEVIPGHHVRSKCGEFSTYEEFLTGGVQIRKTEKKPVLVDNRGGEGGAGLCLDTVENLAGQTTNLLQPAIQIATSVPALVTVGGLHPVDLVSNVANTVTGTVGDAVSDVLCADTSLPETALGLATPLVENALGAVAPVVEIATGVLVSGGGGGEDGAGLGLDTTVNLVGEAKTEI